MGYGSCCITHMPHPHYTCTHHTQTPYTHTPYPHHAHTHCTPHATSPQHTHHIYLPYSHDTHTHSLSSFILRILTEHLLCARRGARCWGCSMPSPALVLTVQWGCSEEAPCRDREYLSRGHPTSPVSFLSSFSSCCKRRQNYGGENFQGHQMSS